MSLPEWRDLIHTHRDTSEEALQRGQELLESLIQSRNARNVKLPAPRIFA